MSSSIERISARPEIFLARMPAVGRASLLLFGLTLFLSALLLFTVQPLFAKLVLLKLGGSSAVWSVALVFFQAALLLGYAYAHVLAAYLKPRLATLIHMFVLALALLALPISYPGAWSNPPEQGTALWVIAVFTVGVGRRFSRSRRQRHCCSLGSRKPVMPMPPTPTFSIAPATREASWRCCFIPF
jgi:hypothetical protein